LNILFLTKQVSAEPLEVDQDATAMDLAKELGLDLEMDFDFGFDVDFLKELSADGTEEIDEFGLGEKMVTLLIAEAKALGRSIVKLTARQLMKIFLYPMRQLEQLANDIEKRAVESEECVARETVNTAGIVADTTLEFLGCGRTAAVNSINIVLDTKRAVLQLTLDGYSLIKLRRKCKGYTSETLAKMCNVKFGTKLALYAIGAQKSLRHLIGLRRSVPAIATDATSCTTQATDNAIQGFNDINAGIDTCIATIV
ncbi:hypothetical protein KR009_004541, partial [Drosophila setifemur]